MVKGKIAVDLIANSAGCWTTVIKNEFKHMSLWKVVILSFVRLQYSSLGILFIELYSSFYNLWSVYIVFLYSFMHISFIISDGTIFDVLIEVESWISFLIEYMWVELKKKNELISNSYNNIYFKYFKELNWKNLTLFEIFYVECGIVLCWCVILILFF